MKGTQNPIAVVLGNAATGLYVARELGRAGVRVCGVSRRRESGGASKYLYDYVVCPRPDETISFLLNRVASDDAKPVLIPASDHYIELVSANATRLSQHFSFQSSYANGLAQRLVGKSVLYEECSHHGVDLPHWRLATRNSFGSSLEDLEFPIFVKPNQIHHVKHTMKGQKGWIVDKKEDLGRLSDSLPPGDHTFIAQEIIPGPESEILLYCAYFDVHGKARQTFTGRKLRQYPPGFGSASLVVSEACAEAKEISERFLTALGYQGIAACEFKRDPRDGKLKLIEINPRPSLWFSIAGASGKYVTLAAYHDIGNTGVTVPEVEQIDGVGWRYSSRDIYSANFYRKIQNFILPRPDATPYRTSSKRTNAVFSKDDPGPAIMELKSNLRSIIRRLSGSGERPDDQYL